MHAIEVEAPREAVWPWLAQIGQDRGSFYSYEWLENLAGCRMRNAERIHPEWQHRGIGDKVMLDPLRPPSCAHPVLLQILPLGSPLSSAVGLLGLRTAASN